MNSAAENKSTIKIANKEKLRNFTELYLQGINQEQPRPSTHARGFGVAELGQAFGCLGTLGRSFRSYKSQKYMVTSDCFCK